MRLSLLVVALLLVGCDAFFDPVDDNEREAAVERLEGVWTRSVRAERIAYDGAVMPQGQPEASAIEIAREVICNRSQPLRAEGDLFRAFVVFDPDDATAFRSCGILTVDRDQERVVFLGATMDEAANLAVDEDGRQEWHFYGPRDDGTVIRTIWSLTR
ncbi:hypothetical protein B1759_10575 [Rubrivirga sp. SAORIC476]|uniref:hypothetical protein n=1 Tax=Rubrivirga sp. SAORIC476 TaxID=1961794 RepID=UPI000BA995CA|nr:hypothetical protein [Rubrivirga sp. SAORIC476]PAP81731.1 hypothetical protein B1759_10575 [Rubrivirga sp. SAORIC476]